MKKFIVVEREDTRTALINVDAIDIIMEDMIKDKTTGDPVPVLHLIFPNNLKITIRETLKNFETRMRGSTAVTISRE
jgi:hypothetical protein